MTCGERYFPADKPLSATLVGYVCTREVGHPPPHRRGPKVYCGEIYRKGQSKFYCNLDRGHRGLHGWEPPVREPEPEKTFMDRLVDLMTRPIW